MKKLISAKNIEELFNSGKMRLEINSPETIVTPQAQTMAQQLGVELIEANDKFRVSFADRQKIISEVQSHYANGTYSKAKITKAVKVVLAGLNNVS